MKSTTKLYNAATGKEFSTINDFLDFYNNCYYVQTSQWVEKQITELLKKGKMEEQDLFNILAWKTNRINHQKSEDTKSFVYTGSSDKNTSRWNFDFEKEEATAVTRRTIDNLFPFLKYISRELNTTVESAEILKLLKEKSPEGIGTVYLITFLYFITHGNEPIYDVFAMAALDAIYPKNQDTISLTLGSYVKMRELPSKNDNGFQNLLNPQKPNHSKSNYIIYKEKLNVFMEEVNSERISSGKNSLEYKDCRDIDRALWVYGHLFRSKK